MATNYFQGLPIPKELKDALSAETSAEDDSSGGGGNSVSVRSLVDADGVPGTGPLTGILVFEILASRANVWV